MSRRRLAATAGLGAGIAITSATVGLSGVVSVTDPAPWLAVALVFGVLSFALVTVLLAGLVRDLLFMMRQIRDRSESIGDRVAHIERRLGGTDTDTSLDRRVAELAAALHQQFERSQATEQKRDTTLAELLDVAGKEIVDAFADLTVESRNDVIEQIRKLEQAGQDLASDTRKEVIEQIHKIELVRSDRIVGEVLRTYQQIEGLISIYQSLRPDAPLTPFRGWAISPDTGAHLARVVYDERPELVVEGGSGLSTAVLGLAIRGAGSGRLVSLEHDERYANATRRILEAHGLSAIATVVHAPLVPVDIGDVPWSWYDLSRWPFTEESIGLLFVDGPPGPSGELARYPAVPLLWPYLEPDAIIVVDDADRRDETEMVRRWVAEMPGLSAEHFAYDKGLIELRRK